MHNLALTLQQQGYAVTGSDDEIYEPSRTRLSQQNLLPSDIGWFPDKIHRDLDAVIVGMHARNDNPELIRAQALGLPVFSYPDYIYQQSRQKQRVVIAGSHGKTTITSIILHVLKHFNRSFDYLVGAQIDGFETMARITPDAPIIIIEGDESASSPIDLRPKFIHYRPHIALISGIAWDHVNIYPTWDEYVDQFELLAEAMPKAGILLFDDSDDMLDVIGQKERPDVTKIPYQAHPYEVNDSQTYLITKRNQRIPVVIFGEHNMKNIAGAMAVLDRIGITEDQFYEAIPTFKGADGRLQKLAEKGGHTLFRDFAHSPSKVEASTNAVKNQYPGRKLSAIVELAAASTLNQAFLEQYKGCLDKADSAAVYINPQSVADKQPDLISLEAIRQAFERPDLIILIKAADLQAYLAQQLQTTGIILILSSGAFGELDVQLLFNQLLHNQ